MASGLAETAKLVSSLELKDNFTPTANRAIHKLGQMESTAFRVGQGIGKGLRNAAANIAKIGVVGAVALGGVVAAGVKSLGDLQRSQAQTAAVIKSTGGKAKVSADQVRALAEAQEDLTTVDDKVIQDGENLLLTFTNIGNKVFPEATRAMTNLGVAMAGGNVEQVDLKASAIQLGKALNDPIKGITALRKVGVSFTADQVKAIKTAVKHGNVLKAQRIILAELNTEFGKAGEAAGKGPEAVWRRLQDAGEGLSQVLSRGVLPSLERFGKFLTAKLADKEFLAQVDEFGQRLGDAMGEFIDFLETVDFKAIGRTLGIAADAAGTLVGWFMKMPAWVQTAVIGGWGLNKLTGGALGDIFGTLAGGLIKGVLGMNAGVVNIKAGTVVGVGGGAGVPGGKAGKVTSAATLLSRVFIVGAAAGVFYELKQAVDAQAEADRAQAEALTLKTNEYVKVVGIPEMQQALSGILAYDAKLSTDSDLTHLDAVKFQFNINGVRDAVRAQEATIQAKLAELIQVADKPTTIAEKTKGAAFGGGGSPTGSDRPLTTGPTADKQRQAVEKVQTAVETMKGKIADELATSSTNIAEATRAGAGSVLGGVKGTSSAVTTAGYGIQSAIRANRPIVNVDVQVSATTVEKTTNVVTRYGPSGGDRDYAKGAIET